MGRVWRLRHLNPSESLTRWKRPAYCFHMPLPNGAAIKAIRQAKGLKGVDLAAAVGISHGHLFNIESARRKRASDEVLYRISVLLEVPLAAVCYDVEPAGATQDVA